MAEGCNEKFDFEFFKWIMYLGRTKDSREKYKRIISQYKEKTIVIRNQRQLDRYIKDLEKNN